MLILLLLFTSSQLWYLGTCPSVAPPVRFHWSNLAGQWSSMSLGGKVSMNPYDSRTLNQGRIGTTIKNQNINQTIGRALDPTVAAVNVTKKIRLVVTTRLYWNMSNEHCDYLRIRCLRAFATGALCARTLFYTYYTFPNYCTMDFHNCMNRYDIWSVAYMGMCTEVEISKDLYVDMGYDQMANNSFLKQMYTEDSGDITNVG